MTSLVTAPLWVTTGVCAPHNVLLQVPSTFILLEQFALSRKLQQVNVSDPVPSALTSILMCKVAHFSPQVRKVIQTYYMMKSYIERKIHYKATNKQNIRKFLPYLERSASKKSLWVFCFWGFFGLYQSSLFYRSIRLIGGSPINLYFIQR